MSVYIWDQDPWDVDLIARYEGIFMPRILSSKWTQIPINRADLEYQNDIQ